MVAIDRGAALAVGALHKIDRGLKPRSRFARPAGAILRLNMPALDTTPDAAAAQRAAYRNLGETGRLRIAFQLSDLVRALAVAGIRKRNPDYTEEQVMKVLTHQLYGADARLLDG
jgi:hypothetical protein